MNMLFRLISLSLILCLSDKLTLYAADLSAESRPLLTEYDDSAQQHITAASVTPVIDTWSQIPKHLEKAKLSLEGVLLFNSHSYFNYAIKASTVSNWSHVGLLVRDTCYHYDDRRGWYIFESVADPSLTGVAAPSIAGVYNIRLASWHHGLTVSDDVTVRHLHYQNGNRPSSDALKGVISKYIGRPYEQNFSELINGAIEANTVENSRSISCGELNALVLQDLGLLSKSKLADNFIPAHFSLERHLSALPLVDTHLGREHVIQQVPRSIFRAVFDSVTGVLRFFAYRLGVI